MISNELRKCKKCRQKKSRDCFYRDARFPDGVDVQCCECRKAKVRKWRAKNPEKARAIEKRSRVKNAEACRRRAKLWHQNNRDRHLAYCAKRRKENPRAIISGKLRATYGISIEQYESILAEQNGGCAICGESKCQSGRRLAVDHCHDTKTVRGILCGNCNKGIGCFQDSPDLLMKAARYLGKFKILNQTKDQK